MPGKLLRVALLWRGTLIDDRILLWSNLGWQETAIRTPQESARRSPHIEVFVRDLGVGGLLPYAPREAARAADLEEEMLSASGDEDEPSPR